MYPQAWLDKASMCYGMEREVGYEAADCSGGTGCVAILSGGCLFGQDINWYFTGCPLKDGCSGAPLDPCEYYGSSCTHNEYRIEAATYEYSNNFSDSFSVTSSSLGRLLTATFSSTDIRESSCYGKIASWDDCPDYTSTNDHSTDIMESWGSSSSITITFGFDLRCRATFQSECVYVREQTADFGEEASIGSGRTVISVKDPKGGLHTIGTLPYAMAYYADEYRYEYACSSALCNKCGNDAVVTGLNTSNSHEYANSDSWVTTSNEWGIIEASLFPRNLYQPYFWSFLNNGILNSYAINSFAEVLKVSFQCNKDTFGHWMLSAFIEIQPLAYNQWGEPYAFGDPIYYVYNYLSTGHDPIALIGAQSEGDVPAYFENVSVTGPRTL
jgi:hypothetical protein